MVNTGATEARARLRAIPWWGWTLVAIAAVIALVAAVGGFADTPIEKVPTIQLGEVYEGRQVDMSVESVELVTELPGAITVEDGNQLAVVTVRLINHADAPVSRRVLDMLLLINDIDYVESPESQLTAREYADSPLQPGVPTDYLYIWQVPSSLDDGQAAIVGMLEAVPDEDSLYGEGDLTEPVAVRRIDVTLDRGAPRAGEGS